jgi:hypothetical protein
MQIPPQPAKLCPPETERKREFAQGACGLDWRSNVRFVEEAEPAGASADNLRLRS